MASTNHTADKLSEEAKAPVLALLAKGQKSGVLQSAEILSVLEKLDINAEQIEHIYDTIESMGIQIMGAELELDAPEGAASEEEEELVSRAWNRRRRAGRDDRKHVRDARNRYGRVFQRAEPERNVWEYIRCGGRARGAANRGEAG